MGLVAMINANRSVKLLSAFPRRNHMQIFLLKTASTIAWLHK